MALTPTTKLQAINTMLSTIGCSPISSLSGYNSADTALAIQILDEINLSVQSEGWHWNTEEDVELVPDPSSGEIVVSPNALLVDVDGINRGNFEVVLRGNKLYDKKNKTTVFENTIKATMIYGLDWEEIPQAARGYIMIRAARTFGDRMVGSEKHHGFTLRDEVFALMKLREYEGETADRNIFDNYSTYRIIDRNYPEDFTG